MKKKKESLLEHYERVFTLSMWRQKAYLRWRRNRYKTNWSLNPIKRFKYCIHEWRWNAFHSKVTWIGNTFNWIGIYIGVIK